MRKKIYAYIIEIVTIFIGITLSFAFEEFRQARNEKLRQTHTKLERLAGSLKSYRD